MKIGRFVLFLVIIFTIQARGQDDARTLDRLEQNTEISGNWFLAYTFNDRKNLNQYGLKRGYFTVKTKLNEMFSTRYTQDVTLDQEGSDAGNVEIRLKYLYIKAELERMAALQNSYFEFGLVHRPWLSFESNINKYRVQGKMFAERHGIINSADFGLTYAGLIGGQINKNYQKKVNSNSPGKYGSFAIGVFNGGGYHSIELNNNKTVEGRLSLRPFYDNIPGLQFTYAWSFGKANLPANTSDFNMNIFMVSYESPRIVLTGEYYTGKGDYEDNYIDLNNNSYDNNGFSLFGELKIPGTNFSLIGRYDDFTSFQEKDFNSNIMVGGLAYRFLDSKMVIDYNRNTTTGEGTVNDLEAALEISF